MPKVYPVCSSSAVFQSKTLLRKPSNSRKNRLSEGYPQDNLGLRNRRLEVRALWGVLKSRNDTPSLRLFLLLNLLTDLCESGHEFSGLNASRSAGDFSCFHGFEKNCGDLGTQPTSRPIRAGRIHSRWQTPSLLRWMDRSMTIWLEIEGAHFPGPSILKSSHEGNLRASSRQAKLLLSHWVILLADPTG